MANLFCGVRDPVEAVVGRLGGLTGDAIRRLDNSMKKTGYFVAGGVPYGINMESRC